MGFSPGSNILFYKCLGTRETGKVKLLTSELKPSDLEALQSKLLSFLFFQKDHSAGKQLEPGTGLGGEASEDFLFSKRIHNWVE